MPLTGHCQTRTNWPSSACKTPVAVLGVKTGQKKVGILSCCRQQHKENNPNQQHWPGRIENIPPAGRIYVFVWWTKLADSERMMLQDNIHYYMVVYI